MGPGKPRADAVPGATMTDDELRARIEIDPKIMVGQPCIRGTRIPVRLILDLLAHGAPYDEIIEDYPSVTSDDIAACLLYAVDTIEHASATSLAPTR
jgi:uncharacterized protein (DUF433 family)